VVHGRGGGIGLKGCERRESQGSGNGGPDPALVNRVSEMLKSANVAASKNGTPISYFASRLAGDDASAFPRMAKQVRKLVQDGTVSGFHIQGQSIRAGEAPAES
jgi:hypothetical protein